MAAGSSLLGDRHDAVLRSRNSAPNEQQVPLRVHLDHAQPKLGVTLGPHVTGHPLSLNDTRRVGARADRARFPVPGVAVGGWTAAEMVAVHDALKSPALGGP